MEKYKDINNDSGVEGYIIGINYLDVKFSGTGRIYRYSYESAGKDNVEHMKLLAKTGDGLNAFINTKVRTKYEK